MTIFNLDSIGGYCPVQAYGSIDDQRFYFRARGEHWQFHVAPTDADIFYRDTFSLDREYGDEEFAAGWMDVEEAITFIAEAMILYEQHQNGSVGQ